VWDRKRRTLVKEYDWPGLDSFAVLPGGKRIVATADTQRWVRDEVWDPETGVMQALPRIQDHRSFLQEAGIEGWSSDGRGLRFFLDGHHGYSIDLESGKVVGVWPLGSHSGRILASHPSRPILAIRTEGGELDLRDGESGRILWTLPLDEVSKRDAFSRWPPWRLAHFRRGEKGQELETWDLERIHRVGVFLVGETNVDFLAGTDDLLLHSGQEIRDMEGKVIGRPLIGIPQWQGCHPLAGFRSGNRVLDPNFPIGQAWDLQAQALVPSPSWPLLQDAWPEPHGDFIGMPNREIDPDRWFQVSLDGRTLPNGLKETCIWKVVDIQKGILRQCSSNSYMAGRLSPDGKRLWLRLEPMRAANHGWCGFRGDSDVERMAPWTPFSEAEARTQLPQ
jgi:hypothetical protein